MSRLVVSQRSAGGWMTARFSGVWVTVGSPAPVSAAHQRLLTLQPLGVVSPTTLSVRGLGPAVSSSTEPGATRVPSARSTGSRVGRVVCSTNTATSCWMSWEAIPSAARMRRVSTCGRFAQTVTGLSITWSVSGPEYLGRSVTTVPTGTGSHVTSTGSSSGSVALKVSAVVVGSSSPSVTEGVVGQPSTGAPVDETLIEGSLLLV